MSQVIKLKKGNKTPKLPKLEEPVIQDDVQIPEQKPMLGNFSMNGKTIHGQNALDRLFSVYKDRDVSERGMFNVADKAIRDGYNVTYNAGDNTIQVVDSNGNDITNNYMDGIKAKTTDSLIKRTWDATFRNRADAFKRSGRYMQNIDMSDDSEKVTAPKFKWERGNNDWWTTKKVDNNDVYDSDDIMNQDRWNTVVNNFTNIIGSSKIEDIMNASAFDMSAWTGHESDLTQLRKLYNEVGGTKEARDQYLNNLKQRLVSDNLTEGDYNILRLMGFVKPKVQTSTETSSNNGNNNTYTIPDGWTGNTDAAKDAGVTISHNDDGTWSITGPDEYTKNTWYNKGLKFLENTPFADGFIINGILRSKDDILANPDNYQDKIGSFMSLGNSNGWNDWYDRANASGVRFVGDRIWTNQGNDYYGIYNNYNSNTDYVPALWDFLNKNRINYGGVSDVSNLFDLSNKPGVKVYSYLDPSKRNYAGVYIPQYVIRTNNSLNYTSDNIDDIANKLGVSKSAYPQTPASLTINPYEDVRGIQMALTRQFGKQGQEVSLGRDKNGTYYIYRGNEIDPIQLTGYGRERDQEVMHKIMQYIRGELPWTWKDIEALKVQKPFVPADTASTVAFKKDGGKINWNRLQKLQFGGSIQNTSANKVNSSKISESSKDITKDHKMNGSDGGLTQSEVNQLIAAGLDLGGVVASMFGPAGNVAGAATGAAGSIMRYKADKAQGDENGVKNAGWELAANLGLDVLSAVPVAGILAKSAKATKALNSIRKVAKPLMTLAMTAGMTSMVTPLKKMISGEELTSQDLVDLGKGLSSGVLFGRGAAKSIKKGVGARLLATDAKKAAQQAKATAKIGDKTITKTRRELEDLIEDTGGSRKEMVSKIKSEAKSMGVELSDAGAKKALSDLGINWTGNTREGWSIKHPFSRGKVIDRIGSLPALSDGRSTLGYAWRDMLGGFGNGKIDATIASTVPTNTLRAVIPGFSGNSSKNFYLNELMYNQPNLFNNVRFKNAQFPIGWRSYQYNRRVKPQFLPDNYYKNEANKAIESGVGLISNTQLSSHINTDLGKTYIPALVNNYGIMRKSYLPHKKQNNNIDDMLEYLKETHSLKKGGSIPKFQSGGFTGNALQVDKNKIRDVLSNIAGDIASNKAWREEKASIGALANRTFQAPVLTSPRFSTATIDQKYNAASEPYKTIQFNSSDNRENLAGKLQSSYQQGQLQAQKGAEISDYINKFNQADTERINKQREFDANIANQKSDYYAQLNSQLMARKSLKTQSDFGRWNEMYYQWRQEAKDASNKLAQLEYQNKSTIANQDYADKIKTSMYGYKDWKKAYDADTSANKLDFATWVRTNRANEYNEWLESDIVKKIRQKLQDDLYNYGKQSLYTREPIFKSGGKISNDNKFALESSKASKKAIRDAANHLNKLLQQLLK